MKKVIHLKEYTCHGHYTKCGLDPTKNWEATRDVKKVTCKKCKQKRVDQCR